MARIALGLEYDGTDFVGWQAQPQGRSVQAALTDAVTEVANEPVVIHGAGRTDAGVHALYQVAHFDSAARRAPRQWVLGINSNLPADVAAQWAVEVPDDFDARRSAVSRMYRYRVVTRATRPALARRSVWWLRKPLDCGAMSAAAVHWLGEQDFSAFRAANCQSRTPMRHMRAIRVARAGADEIAIEFRANAFLYHMVRNLVGTLVEIGAGDAPPSRARELLLSRDRAQAPMTAPACGLTLADVTYPAAYALPRAPA
jgi:tRNA pseudouridine38-40 synthase